MRETQVGGAASARRVRKQTWTEADVRALGVRTDLRTAGDVLGIGETTTYQLARRGEFPAPVIRLGRVYVVPIAGLLAALGIETEQVAAVG